MPASIEGTRGERSYPVTPTNRHRLRGAAAVAALLTAVPLGLSACGSDSGTASQQATATSNVGDQLTIAQETAPLTLDPAKTVQNNAWLEELAYEPLIVRQSDGSLTPGLAASWSYSGSGNTTFVIHLRAGVRFSDGSSLTAQDVADDLRYVVTSSGQMAPFFTGDSFTATGPLTVTIKAAQPNPDFPEILTQDDVVGGMISENGLHHSAGLGTQTFGAGPYKLDPAQSVAGDSYTYVPNPYYYRKAAVHWRKVVVKIITSPQAVLNAMKTGEVDVAVGDPSTIDSAQQAGFTVTARPFLWEGVTLADRGGSIAKPLADVRVRQALNYATDRAPIASALFPGVGAPTSEMTVPGGYGSDPSLENAYPYDIGKAEQLLAAAGYPHGFTLRLVTADYGSMNLIAQALAQQWKKIGVDLQITDDANANTYTSAAFGAQFPAFMTSFGQLPLWIEGPALYLPPAAFNPFHTADQNLMELYNEEARSSSSAQVQFDKQIEAYLVHNAWFVPVVTTDLPYYARKSVAGVQTSPQAPLLELYGLQNAA